MIQKTTQVTKYFDTKEVEIANLSDKSLSLRLSLNFIKVRKSWLSGSSFFSCVLPLS